MSQVMLSCGFVGFCHEYAFSYSGRLLLQEFQEAEISDAPCRSKFAMLCMGANRLYVHPSQGADITLLDTSLPDL